MKQWYNLVCPVCGWRRSPQRFIEKHQPINYPVELVTGGGRARGFSVLRYLPWSELPTLRGTVVWDAIRLLYHRLGHAYDTFYEILGFLSPRMRLLLHQMRLPYEDSYQIELSYGALYSEPLSDISEPYRFDSDYPQAYKSGMILLAR